MFMLHAAANKIAQAAVDRKVELRLRTTVVVSLC